MVGVVLGDASRAPHWLCAAGAGVSGSRSRSGFCTGAERPGRGPHRGGAAGRGPVDGCGCGAGFPGRPCAGAAGSRRPGFEPPYAAAVRSFGMAPGERYGHPFGLRTGWRFGVRAASSGRVRNRDRPCTRAPRVRLSGAPGVPGSVWPFGARSVSPVALRTPAVRRRVTVRQGIGHRRGRPTGFGRMTSVACAVPEDETRGICPRRHPVAATGTDSARERPDDGVAWEGGRGAAGEQMSSAFPLCMRPLRDSRAPLSWHHSRNGSGFPAARSRRARPRPPRAVPRTCGAVTADSGRTAAE
ncbi:hypothetical protein HMPREF1486_05400 [Streptomyces sp. HPH0547]|nr:hypothetical protein HMPREF1486_05400 [Streptomyces sp. HPH0547]